MLDKLYITPRQWLRILRWTLYCVLLVLMMMLQTVVFGNRTVFGIHPDLVPLVITCICLREGPERGGLFALLASLGWCLSGVDLGSVRILILTVVPVLGSLLCHSVLANRFLPCFIFTLLTLFCEQSAMFLLKHFFGTLPAHCFPNEALPCVLISVVLQPVVYWAVKATSRIGDAYESA